MRKLNPAHVQAVIALINQGPFFKLLSMEVRDLGLGYARVEVDLETKHHNPFGGVHGGVYSSLIDTAAFWAVYGDIDENSGFTSLDITVDNLAAIKAGRLIVEGKRLKVGRSICLAEATITDQQGKYLAHGTSKMMVTPSLQDIGQAIAALGHQSLPPKFID
ncbi:MAG: PaaI family thioesterase [Firmicutes bacterium]|nr:PaaI family thioesterase [Bacillota bacterium]